MTPDTLKRDRKYKFRHEYEVLLYIGRCWSGNGHWYQFVLEAHPNAVWSELQDRDLHLIEEVIETKQGGQI